MKLHEKINLSSGRELNLINRFAELLLDRERYARVCREAAQCGTSVFDYFTEVVERESEAGT